MIKTRQANEFLLRRKRSFFRLKMSLGQKARTFWEKKNMDVWKDRRETSFVVEEPKRFMTRKDRLCLIINFQANIVVVAVVVVVVIFCWLNLIAVVYLLSQIVFARFVPFETRLIGKVQQRLMFNFKFLTLFDIANINFCCHDFFVHSQQNKKLKWWCFQNQISVNSTIPYWFFIQFKTKTFHRQLLYYVIKK